MGYMSSEDYARKILEILLGDMVREIFEFKGKASSVDIAHAMVSRIPPDERLGVFQTVLAEAIQTRLDRNREDAFVYVAKGSRSRRERKVPERFYAHRCDRKHLGL